MNYKFNLGNVSFNMAGQGTVEVKDISVELTDLNLKEIPSIIKETRKAFKEIKELVEEDVKPAVEQFTRPAMKENTFAGQDTDGDLGVDPFMEFLREMGEANAAHHEEEECCGGLDSILSDLVQEAIQAKHPGAHIIKTPMGFAVAIPKGANE